MGQALTTLGILILACLWAGALGDHHGRRAERVRLFRKWGVRSSAGLRKATNGIEKDMRRSLGLPRVVADPESRPRQHRAVIRR